MCCLHEKEVEHFYVRTYARTQNSKHSALAFGLPQQRFMGEIFTSQTIEPNYTL